MRLKKPIPMNMDLNFKKESKQEETFLFFNCDRCGFHESVIEKYWIKGDMDNFILCIKEIHPNYEKIIETVGEGLKTDGILCTEYICGKCKGLGNMLPVPAFALNMFGFKVPSKDLAKEEDGENKEIKLLEGLKALFLKKKSEKKKKAPKKGKADGSDKISK